MLWSAAGSLGRRLAFSLGAGLFALWLASAVSAALVVSRELNEVFDSILMETAQIILPDLLRHFGADIEDLALGQPIIVAEATPHDEYLTWRLYGADGRLLMRSHGAAMAPMPSIGFETVDNARLYSEASVGDRYIITIAEPAGHRQETVNPTLVRLLAPMFGLVLVALFTIPLIIRLGFAPIRAMQAEIAARSGSDLRPIETASLPSELAAIGEDVNQLLRRLRQTLEAERSFSANAAHELRTPVATTLAEAQLLAARLPPGSIEQEDVARMTASLRALGGRLEKLLQLARAEAGVALKLEKVDLLLPLQLLVDEFAARPGVGDRLRLDDGGLATVMVAADLDALAIAFRNLIENALRHGPDTGDVTVSVTADGTVRVVSDGPAIPPARLETLARRFVSHGGRGSGLGLSIVQTIADQIGGRLDLASPAPGRSDGFEARLTLPVVVDAG